jgi:hypothetical protein
VDVIALRQPASLLMPKDAWRGFLRFFLSTNLAGRGSIMRSKKGKVLPKKGKVLHQAGQDDDSVINYVSAMAGALREELGTTHQGIKLAMRWTGASERTVKYWFAGTSGPNGEHLIALARHSDLVLEMFLRKAGRHRYAGALHLVDARETLRKVLQTVQSIIDDGAHH